MDSIIPRIQGITLDLSSATKETNPPHHLNHEQKHKKEIVGFVFGFFAALAAAIMAVLIKSSQGIPTQTMVFARFIVGLPFLLPFFLTKKVAFSFRVVPKHLLRALAGLATLYCYFYSVKMLPLVNAVTLGNTQPLFMPIVILIWLRVVVSKTRFIAVIIGFAGVLILLRPSNLMGDWASLIGLVGGFLSAIALVGVRVLSKEESTEAIICYYFLIATVFSFFPMFFEWTSIPDSKAWIHLLLIGVIATIYQYLITLSYTYAPASKVSTMNYLGVVFGGLSGWWFFGETPDYWVLLGSALIIGSALLALFDKTPLHDLKK